MDNDSILRNLDSASNQIKKQLGTNQGGTANENNYGMAYQQAVAAGLKPQIRKKYR